MGAKVAKRQPLVPDAVYDANQEVPDDFYEGVYLTPLEIQFVNYYVGESRFSAADAYNRARGKNDRQNQGYKLLHRPHIAAAIKDRLKANALSAEEALSELATVAMAPLGDLVEVKTRNGEVVDVKVDLAPKVRALEIILRAYNMLDNKAAVQAAIQVNINTPGLSEDELA